MTLPLRGEIILYTISFHTQKKITSWWYEESTTESKAWRVILSFQSQGTLWPEITLVAKPRREPPMHIHHSHCLAAGNHTFTRCS